MLRTNLMFSSAVAAAAAVALVAACGGSDATKVNAPEPGSIGSATPGPSSGIPAPPPSTASAPTETQPTTPTSPPDTAPPPSSGTSPTAANEAAGERVGAPLFLKLNGPDSAPAKGDFKLNLEIVANAPIATPVKVKVTVPSGAKLVSGKAEETLTLKQAGTTAREYTVHTDAAMTGAVVVTADSRDPKGGSGLHAERRYPADFQATTPVAPTATPARPPVPRPPGPPPVPRR